MKTNSTLTIALALLASLFTLHAPTAYAQGIRVHTKAGKTVNYPAETFNHMSPVISGSPNLSGINVYKTDGSYDNYKESDIVGITTYEAATDEVGTPQTTIVPQTGGTVSLGDLSVEFPAGTFSGNTPTTLTEVKKGFIDGDAELSTYYKVKFSDGVRKSFKVSVKMPQLPNDENVKMQFAMMGWAPSFGVECMVYRYMDVTYIDGAYVAEIPEMESPDDAGAIDVWFGITKCDLMEEATARSLAESSGRTDFKLYNKAGNTEEVTSFLSILEDSWIPNSIKQLEELGYTKPEGSVINCYLRGATGIIENMFGGKGSAGWLTFSPWDKKYSTFNLSYSHCKTHNEDYNKGSVIHELFHYYQQFYDKRSSFKLRYASKSTPLILEEASSTWSERFYTETPSNVKDYAWLFVPSMNPDYKDILDLSKDDGITWGDRFGNVGYGAAALLEYLTKKCGNKILLEMWEERKTGDPYDTRDRIERIANKHGIDIFSQNGYHDFIEMLGTNNLYKEMSFGNLVKLREEHDSIGVLSREVKNTCPLYHTNYVYGYGALVEELVIPMVENKVRLPWEDYAAGIIEQTVEGLTTWVYNDFETAPLGVVKKGSPLIIKPEWFRNGGTRPRSFYYVTIPDDFKTTRERISRIVSRAFFLNMPEKNITVPSNPGTKGVKFSSNYYDLSFKTDADWLTCFWSVTDSTLRVRHETMPDNIESRKGVIQVITSGDDGTDVVLEELEVTQTKTFIDLSTTDVKVDAKGGTKEISITSTNCSDIKVSTESNFLHPTISGNTISVTIDPNTSYDEREGAVIVSGVMPVTGIKVERFISFTQAAIPSSDIIALYNDGTVQVDGIWIDIPGKTLKYGNYFLYRSSDTQIEKTKNTRTEFSWNVEFYIDPKDNKSMRHYELISGSVTWLRNYYYTETDNEGKTTEHQNTTRCSYNLKKLMTDDGLVFGSSSIIDGKQHVLSDYVSDYSYQETRDGKPVNTVTQADIADQPAYHLSVKVALQLAAGVPYLEANRDSISHDGSDGFEIIGFTNNDAVFDIEVTTSADWLTIENFNQTEYGGNFYLNNTVNNSKAPRTGYVYITGTLSDGSKLTRTIVVYQEYDPIWDDDITEQENQKAELPTQDVLDALQQGGMPLYLGQNPPKLNGVYKMEPLKTIYEKSIDGEGSEDNGYVSSLVLLLTSNASHPANAMMSYYCELTSGTNLPADDYYCYVSGDDNQFTLSNLTTVTYEGLFSYTIVTMISGTLDGNQVRDLYFANVIIDEDGIIESISIGTDGDGISPTTNWNPGEEDDYDWEAPRRATLRHRK